MYPWKTIIKIDVESRLPIFLQITNAIIKEIKNGHIRPNVKLPGARTLAQILNTNRQTISNAYDELFTQGWVSIIPQSGVFISGSLPIIAPQAFTDAASSNFKNDKKNQSYKNSYDVKFDDGFPDTRLAPVSSLVKTYRRIATTNTYRNLLSYSDAQGDEKLRRVLAMYLNDTRGLTCTANNILITRGSQMGLYLISQVLVQAHDKVILGESNYITATQLFENRHANIFKVKIDEYGMVVDEIDDICKKNSISCVYITSHHHHPTTVTLSADRRMKLIMLANKYDFLIIEDDYDYDFHFDSAPTLPLASSDFGEKVLYVGSFSKTLAPAFRVGYVVGSMEVINKLIKLRKLIDHQGDVILERSLAELILDGEINRYLRKALSQYKVRRDIMCDFLKTEFHDVISFNPPEGGMAIYAKFDKGIDLLELKISAAEKKLFIQDAREYGLENNALRIGFASLTPEESEVGLNILRALIKS